MDSQIYWNSPHKAPPIAETKESTLQPELGIEEKEHPMQCTAEAALKKSNQ